MQEKGEKRTREGEKVVVWCKRTGKLLARIWSVDIL